MVMNLPPDRMSSDEYAKDSRLFSPNPAGKFNDASEAVPGASPTRHNGEPWPLPGDLELR
jgi:hypothetical protein